MVRSVRRAQRLVSLLVKVRDLVLARCQLAGARKVQIGSRVFAQRISFIDRIHLTIVRRYQPATWHWHNVILLYRMIRMIRIATMRRVVDISHWQALQ